MESQFPSPPCLTISPMILLVDWCRASLLTAHHTICTSNLLSLLLEATSLAHTPLPWELGLWIPVLAWPVALNSLFDIQLTDRLRKTAPFVAGSAALVIQARDAVLPSDLECEIFSNLPPHQWPLPRQIRILYRRSHKPVLDLSKSIALFLPRPLSLPDNSL